MVLWYCPPVTCHSSRLHFANDLVSGIMVLSPRYLLQYVAFCQCQWYFWGWAGCWNVVPEGKPCPNLIVCTSLFSWANHQFAAYETVLDKLLSILFAIQIFIECSSLWYWLRMLIPTHVCYAVMLLSQIMPGHALEPCANGDRADACPAT